MRAPRQGTTKATQHKVPMDPGSRSSRTRFLVQDTRLVARKSTKTQEHQGEHTQHTGRHLGHDGAKNLGRGVFALPVRVFGHVQCKWRASTTAAAAAARRRRNKARGRSANLRDRNKSVGRSHNQGNKKETELRHDDGEMMIWRFFYLCESSKKKRNA